MNLLRNVSIRNAIKLYATLVTSVSIGAGVFSVWKLQAFAAAAENRTRPPGWSPSSR